MGRAAAPSEAAGTLLLLRWCFHAAQFEMLSCWSITAMAHLPLISPHLGKAVAAVASAVVEGVHATFLGTYDAAATFLCDVGAANAVVLQASCGSND